MSQTKQERNKALVLEAFDALFNRRDYAAAERFWSPGYIQHSAHIAPGREGLFTLVRGLPATLKHEPGVIVAEAISSLSTAASRDSGRRPTGSSRTSSGSRTGSSPSTGRSSRTRPPKSNPGARHRCLARHSPSIPRRRRQLDRLCGEARSIYLLSPPSTGGALPEGDHGCKVNSYDSDPGCRNPNLRERVR
jgi:hypothetical protein